MLLIPGDIVKAKQDINQHNVKKGWLYRLTPAQADVFNQFRDFFELMYNPVTVTTIYNRKVMTTLFSIQDAVPTTRPYPKVGDVYRVDKSFAYYTEGELLFISDSLPYNCQCNLCLDIAVNEQNTTFLLNVYDSHLGKGNYKNEHEKVPF